MWCVGVYNKMHPFNTPLPKLIATNTRMLLFDGYEGTNTLAYMFDEAKADFSSFLFPSVETDGNGVYYKMLYLSVFF